MEALDYDLLYRKGPFGIPTTIRWNSGSTCIQTRAELAMVRCWQTTNLELFEWEAPDQDETPPKNSEIGAMGNC